MAPASDDKLERLAKLYAFLLATPRARTRHEIVREIKMYPDDEAAARQAFERDKKALRDQGVPLIEEVPPDAADDNVHGYRIDRDLWLLPDLGLDRQEELALGLALAQVQLEAEGVGEPITPFDAAAPDVAAVLQMSSPHAVPGLNAAAAERRTIEFAYHGKDRRLDPYSTLFREGFWYVVGHDHDAEEVRVYRADRIDGDVDAGEPGAYEIPDGFRGRDHLAADPTKIGSAPAVVAEVRVDAEHLGRVERWIGAQEVDRHPDGSGTVKVEVVNRPAFRSWVLGLLDHAEVVGPADLRDEMRQWLADVAGSGR